MEFLNKARKKAEAAYHEISHMVADPDRNQKSHQNYSQETLHSGYAGFDTLPWEQHQQTQAQYQYRPQPFVNQQQNFYQSAHPGQAGPSSQYQPAASQQYHMNSTPLNHGQINDFKHHYSTQYHQNFSLQHTSVSNPRAAFF